MKPSDGPQEASRALMDSVLRLLAASLILYSFINGVQFVVVYISMYFYLALLIGPLRQSARSLPVETSLDSKVCSMQ